MKVELGPRDENRFAEVDKDEREYLQFLLTITMGVLMRRPHQVEALEAAAAALTSLGYYHTGLMLDRRLAAIHPDDPMVVYNLACSLSLAGKCEESMLLLANAIDLGYRDDVHMLHDPDLENVRVMPGFLELLRRAAEVG